MDKDQLIQQFMAKPYALNMGANKLAKWWDADPGDVREARKAARKAIRVQRGGLMPKILLFDIETSPLEAYVYQKAVWRSNIRDEQIISEWFMLSWSARFLHSEETLSDVLTSEEVLKEDDQRISKSLWKMLDEADIVIAHNGDAFDVPNINTRFLIHDFDPPSPYKTIDTMRVAKKQFGFTHNSLNGLAQALGFEPKMETNFQLWKDCKLGSDKALEYMEKYNKYDVELLELVYLKLRPWIAGHPNVGLYLESEVPVCPACGSTDLNWTGKYVYTSVSKFENLRCNKCRYARIRTRVNDYPKDRRKQLVTTIYR